MNTKNEVNDLNERDRRLLEKIEEIIANKSSENHNVQLIDGFCNHLAGTMPPSDNAFRQRLETRLVIELEQQKEAIKMSPMSFRKMFIQRFFLNGSRLRTALASTLAFLLLLAGIVTIYPPAHAWAQDLLSYFGFSREPHVLPSAIENSVNTTASAQPFGCSESDRGEVTCATDTSSLLTRNQVQVDVGFTVKAPTYLPSGYLQPDGFEIADQGKAVLWTASKDDLCGPDILLGQSLASEESRVTNPIGTAPVTAVKVLGALGLWIDKVQDGTCTFQTAEGKEGVVTLTASILAWESDGIHYLLKGDSSLGFNEMLKIAESLN